MSPVSSYVAERDKLSDAIQHMVSREHSCVVVMNGKLPVGVITERDVVRLVVERKGAIQQLQAGEVMTSPPVTVLSSMPVHEALTLSRARKLRHLLVVDNERKLIGIVTQTDMVRAYLEEIDAYQQQLEQAVKSRTAALELANRQLLDLAMEDSLTGIGNRRAMEIDLAFTQASAQRYNDVYQVALMDIDSFKTFNDRYGHQRGDDALVEVVTLIKHAMRESDRLYRYGGEEFLLLMPKVSLSQATRIANRARKAVYTARIPHQDSPHQCLTVSGGVAQGSKTHWQESVKAADDALYQAKNHGRNRVVTERRAT